MRLSMPCRAQRPADTARHSRPRVQHSFGLYPYHNVEQQVACVSPWTHCALSVTRHRTTTRAQGDSVVSQSSASQQAVQDTSPNASSSSINADGVQQQNGAPTRGDVTSTSPATPAPASSAASSSQGTPSAATDAAPSASPDLASPWKELAAVLGAIGAFFASLKNSIKQLPAWVHAQTLKKLRDLSDEDPKSADKHAAYLAELNKSQPKEVLARVESEEYATNATVVSEYIRALVLTGKLNQYTAAQTLIPGADGSVLAPGEDHRSLYQLLKDLQAKVAGSQPDDQPGSSVRRPLHINLSSSSIALAGAKRTGPLQWVWSLLAAGAAVVGLACVWLLGSEAVRRMQKQQMQSSPSAASVGQAGVAAGMTASGNPNVDPKEYKKDELPEKAVKTFKDVRGCDEAKEELKEVVEFLKNPAKFTRLGAKLPKGVLLTGPPGTGKTLLARAVAGEAGVPFFYRAGSEFEELYVGVGSRRMRALFQAAKKKAPCIVFIDEIDAIGGNRKHWDNHTRKTLNQLLVEMDGFESNEGVIVMAATNLAETLDPALKRPGRFDRQVAVPLPDVKGRLEILDYYLGDKPVATQVDKALIARQTQGFSGADLSNLVNEAALLAAKQGAEQITPGMLDSAFDKIRMGVERKSCRRTPESIKRTAYHEAGHALVATLMPGASPVHKATIVPRGHALGMVTQVGREDEFSINKQQMLARIWVCMGGHVAEELIFGRDQVTSGATDDLRQATEWARYMVAECGLNEEVGPVFVSERAVREGQLSEQLKQRIDEQVRRLLVEAREGVHALISARLTDLHNLAQALIELETLTAEQITTVLSGGSLPGVAPGGQEPGEGGTGDGGAEGGTGGQDSDPKSQLEGVLSGTAQQHQVAVLSGPQSPQARQQQGGSQ